jgi:predicted dehydrogenase
MRSAADLTTFVKGRALDDNVHVMLRFKPKGGTAAKGMIWASQVAPGNENGLKIRIYGTKGGLEWKQEDPNYLWYTPFGEPEAPDHPRRCGFRPCRRPRDARAARPSGRLSRGLRQHLHRSRPRHQSRPGRQRSRTRAVTFPGIADGVAGMAFIEACVKSSKANGKWTKL